MRLASPVVPLLALTLTGAFLPADAHAGPPWISVELPANPLDATTRGAFLLIHTFHHQTATPGLVSGRAIGMAGKTQRTIPLTFEHTSRPGVMALRRTWPDTGVWVLVLTTGEGHGSATALVTVTGGAVSSIQVPSDTPDGHVVPREVTDQEIAHLLQRVAAMDAPTNERGPAGALWLGAALALVLAPRAIRRRA